MNPNNLKMKGKGAGLRPDLNLVLIGFRATGKTQAGRELARALGRDFVDLDEVLVQEAGRTIQELVALSGWAEFRRREKALVQRYAGRRGLVLATGGGVVLDPENVEALQAGGLIVWLTAPPAAIQRRLALDLPGGASRPSLTSRDPRAEVEEVLKSREPLYRAAARVVVHTDNLTVPEVVQEILSALKAGPEENYGR